MKNIIYFFIFFCILLFSCKREKEEKIFLMQGNYENNLSLLLRQRIPNSSKIIYAYSYAGKYAWSSAAQGQVILDSTEVFTWEKSRNKFPFHIIDVDVKANELYCIKFVDFNGNENGRKEKYQKKYQGMNLIIKDQFFKRGSNMNFIYKYGNFHETLDSIFFEDLSVDFGIILPRTTGFKKGHFTVIEDSCGYVTEFNNKIISSYSLWEKFRVQDSVDMTDTENFLHTNLYDLPALSVIYEFDITLVPDSTSKKKSVSDYGIFKKVNQ
jgi:hypothetical protein